MKKIIYSAAWLISIVGYGQHNSTGTTPLEIRRNASGGEALKISIGDRSGLLEYVQDTDEGTGSHDLTFNISSPLSHFFSWQSNGTELFRINSTGNVGIGTTSPSARFHVQDNSGYAFGFVLANTHSAGHGLLIQGGGTTGNRYILQLKDAIGNDRMTIHDTGEVGIGTISTGSHKLAVDGSIGAREIKVEATGWSDFVFEKGYELKSLEEVEYHIAENGHLPEVPSEKEVTENGINLGEMDAKLLQKIEELTLYLIEQNKEIKALKAKNEELEKRLLKVE